jgi:predicted CXXCH cytochrome family protein
VPTKHSAVGRVLLAATLVGVVLTGACTEDTLVYRDREAFATPADEVAGFLGYFDTDEKFTSCGLCHADEQAAWIETHHADAWATLQASGHAQSFCEPCHTVSPNGNVATGDVGWLAVQDSSYHDVQCESCHGPGADHAANPMAVQPVASFLAASDATNGCGECHAGAHHPFVEQWEESRHGNVSSYAAGREGCNECHDGATAIVAQFSEHGRFLEKGDGEAYDITCVVCHDPHGGPYDAQLRASLESTQLFSNLCVKCHNRRTVPAATTHGPHAAQGPLVLGENVGWWPPGFEWLDGLTGMHGDPEANPRLCATCHVEMFEVTDPTTGDFVFQSVGHLFEAAPCLDADGVPVAGTCDDSQRRFAACAMSGCHGSESLARNLFINNRDNKLPALLREIWEDTNDDHVVNAGDGGLLPQIVAAEGGRVLDVSDTLWTFAEGMLWNAQLAATEATPWFFSGNVVVAAGDTVHFSGHAASGNGAHNPPFVRALLVASIEAGADYYGLPLPAGVDLTLPVAAVAHRDRQR